jgi:hypothetical protein
MRRAHTIDLVFSLTLFCAFAASMLFVLLSGAKIYQGVDNRMEENYEERTCLGYIASKLRHFDAEGAVSLTEFGDSEALLLTQTIDGTEYGTVLYTFQGMVMELFTELPLEFGPEAGSPVLPAESLRFTWASDRLLRVECVGSGGSAAVSVALRAAGEGEDAL